MVLEFNCHGNEKQLEACRYWIDDTSEEIYYGGAKGGGKSYLGCALIFGDAFIYPGTHYFIARKELNDLRKFTMPSIQEVFTAWGISSSQYKYNGQDNYYSLANGSKVYLIACKEEPSDPMFERFGSMQMTRGWIEEAGQIAEAAKRNLWLSIGRWKNEQYGLKKKLLLTLNPNKGWIYRVVYKPNKAGQLPESIKFVRALPQDNKSLPDDYIKSLSELIGVDRQRLFLGNWEYDQDDNALMSYDAILDIFTNSQIPQESRERAITADIALEGSDMFTIFVWEGRKRIHHERIPKSGGKEVLDKLVELKNRFGVPNSRIVFDADGVGGFLKGKGGFLPGAISFNNGASPIPISGEKENYENLKTQCSYKLAKRINEHGIWLDGITGSDKEKIIEELEQIKSKDKDKDGKLKIVPKHEVKANIGRSPDFSDCIMMREYLDLRPARQKGLIRMNR